MREPVAENPSRFSTPGQGCGRRGSTCQAACSRATAAHARFDFGSVGASRGAPGIHRVTSHDPTGVRATTCRRPRSGRTTGTKGKVRGPCHPGVDLGQPRRGDFRRPRLEREERAVPAASSPRHTSAPLNPPADADPAQTRQSAGRRSGSQDCRRDGEVAITECEAAERAPVVLTSPGSSAGTGAALRAAFTSGCG